VRLLGKQSLLRLLFGGVSPPPALAERAAHLPVVSNNGAPTPCAGGTRRSSLQSAKHPSVDSGDPGASRDDLAREPIRSSHFIHFEHPEIVVEAIQEMVQVVHDQSRRHS